MDIRVQSYRPITVQSFGGPGGGFAVSNANQRGPVPAVQPINANQSAGQNQSLAQLANQLRQATNNQQANGGYTDSVRGSTINILA